MFYLICTVTLPAMTLAKTRLQNCYDLCVPNLTPVIEQGGETVTTMYFLYFWITQYINNQENVPKGICTFESQQNSVKRQGLHPFILGFASPICILCFIQMVIPREQSNQLTRIRRVTDSTWQSSPVILPSRWILTFGNLVNFCEEQPILILLSLLSGTYSPPVKIIS